MPLPVDILVARLRNELKVSSRYVRVLPDLAGPSFRFPIEFEIELNKIPGYMVEGDRCMLRFHHRFRVSIGRDYPFEKPTVVWLTPIFHPNIMMPSDGGHLCTKLLEDWSFNSTIITFIKGVESLVMSPNPISPFGTDSCTAAAEYFNGGERHLPPMMSVPAPKVVKPP